MKAVLKSKPGTGFEYREDVDEPKIGPDQVLVRVKAAGICGSDIHLYRGEAIGALPELPLPFIPGHEFAGEIIELGANVKHLKIGDPISAELMVSCGHCYYCHKGERANCTSIRELGVDMNGCYAEYVAVPASNVHILPDGMPWNDAALCDCLSSALHPFEKLSSDILKTVVVLGAGPIGLCGVQIAKTLGAKTVISVDVVKQRLDLAKQLGADHALNPLQVDLAKEVQALTDGIGADAVMEMAGSEETISASVDLVRKNGEIVWMGIHNEPVKLKQFLVMAKAIHIHGCFDYTWLTYERAIHLIASGRVRMNPFVTHRLQLSQVSEAFQLLTRKEAVKVIMKP
jgi:2-desacetyl-2-hydroxyethyl bacteriochlorophyllide A dehydrogenase